jgi:methylmalonyl-CoA mutase N-terminal domain/subunit
MMTRKDYVAVADMLKAYYSPNHMDMQSATIMELVNDFSDFFKKDNPNFNPVQFSNAVLGDK